MLKLVKLPDYISVNDKESSHVLYRPAEEVSFPLSFEDTNIIKILEAKFNEEKSCGGLAAPQIGYPKKIIILSLESKGTLTLEELKKWRTDLTDTLPQSIWINPKYDPIGTETHLDYEACFSVPDVAGIVKRYKKIRYTAFLSDGTKVFGEASGFLARLIQHEVDHINGKLFIEYVPEKERLSFDEYRKRRARAIGKEV